MNRWEDEAAKAAVVATGLEQAGAIITSWASILLELQRDRRRHDNYEPGRVSSAATAWALSMRAT